MLKNRERDRHQSGFESLKRVLGCTLWFYKSVEPKTHTFVISWCQLFPEVCVFQCFSWWLAGHFCIVEPFLCHNMLFLHGGLFIDWHYSADILSVLIHKTVVCNLNVQCLSVVLTCHYWADAGKMLWKCGSSDEELYLVVSGAATT